MAQPIPVEEWAEQQAQKDEETIEKADIAEGVKLMVVSSAGKGEDVACEWAVDVALNAMQKTSPNGLKVARYHLPTMRIAPCDGCYGGGRVCMHPCDRNDIESEIYMPNDKMLTMYEQLIEADALIFATDVRWCGVNHYAQRFIERLNPFVNQAAAGKPVLSKKVAGIITVGDGSIEVAGRLMASLNAVGYSFPRYAYAAWHLSRNANPENAKTAFEKSRSFNEDLELMAQDVMKAVKLLAGAQ